MTVDESGTVRVPRDGEVYWDLAKCGTAAGPSQLSGPGAQRLSVANASRFELHLSGQFCPKSSLPRRVVILMDVSASTSDVPRGSDPCQRLLGIRSFVSSFNALDPVLFALVSFNDNVKYTSGSFKSAPDFLAQSVSFANTCSNSGGTDYSKALSEAARMLEADTTPLASKEVFLITDSIPTAAAAYGRDESARIRTYGIVNTLMIGIGQDGVLKDLVATKDAKGVPLHDRIFILTDMGSVLARRALSDVVSAQISYFPSGNRQNGVVIKVERVEGETFVVRNLQESVTQAPRLVDVVIDYVDARRALYTVRGSASWEP